MAAIKPGISRLVALAALVLLLTAPVFASGNENGRSRAKLKKFKGEVYAGHFSKDSSSGVVLYWVFDDGVFNEYVHDLDADQIRSLAQSTYRKSDVSDGKHKGKYSIDLTPKSSQNLTQPGASTLAVRPMMADQESIDFYFSDDGLTIVDELSLVSIDASNAELDPSLLSSLGTLYTVTPQFWGGCCDLCWAVHENLNEWRRNGIGNIDFHRFDRFCCLRTCPY